MIQDLWKFNNAYWECCIFLDDNREVQAAMRYLPWGALNIPTSRPLEYWVSLLDSGTIPVQSDQQPFSDEIRGAMKACEKAVAEHKRSKPGKNRVKSDFDAELEKLEAA